MDMAAVLLLMSLTLLSGFFVRLLGRKTNPSLILASSFLIIILVGAGLLMLPRATYNGISKKEYVSTIDYSEDYDLKEEDGLVCYGQYSDFMKFWKSVK